MPGEYGISYVYLYKSSVPRHLYIQIVSDRKGRRKNESYCEFTHANEYNYNTGRITDQEIK